MNGGVCALFILKIYSELQRKLLIDLFRAVCFNGWLGLNIIL